MLTLRVTVKSDYKDELTPMHQEQFFQGRTNPMIETYTEAREKMRKYVRKHKEVKAAMLRLTDQYGKTVRAWSTCRKPNGYYEENGR